MEGAMSVLMCAQKKRIKKTQTENPRTQEEIQVLGRRRQLLRRRYRRLGTPNTQERTPTTQEETLRTPEILKSPVDTKERTRFIGDEYQFAENLFEQSRK